MGAIIPGVSARMNYTQVGRDLRDTMTGMQNREDRQMKEYGQTLNRQAMLQQRDQALAQQQANANRTFDFQESNAERQTKEHLAQMEMKAAYQKSMLKNAADTLSMKRGKINYDRNLEAGEIVGAGLGIEESEMTPSTVNVPTANGREIIQKENERLSGMVGTTDAEAQKRYMEYLKKTDPKAYDAYTEKKSVAEQAVDFQRGNMGAMHKLTGNIYGAVKDAFNTTSQAERDSAGIGVKLQEGTQSRSDFLAEIKANEAESKRDIKKFLSTDTEYAKEVGAIETKATKTAARKSEEEIRGTARADILKYAKDNKLSVNSPKILGMQKSVNARVDKILGTRIAADTKKIERAYDQMDSVQKQQFAIQLATLKDQLGRVPTPAEETKMKLDLAKAMKTNQETKDAKGWWD